jgi:hypothetical protein
MYARVGDRIVVREDRPDGAVREAEVVAVERPGGRPPYLVRWADTDEVERFVPSPDAYVDRARPAYPPEYESRVV